MLDDKGILDLSAEGRTHYRPWFLVLFVLLASILVGTVLGLAAQYGLAKMWGFELQNLLGDNLGELSATERSQLRWISLVSHFFTFSFGPLLTAWYLYRPEWLSYLGLTRAPKKSTGFMTLLFILACVPIVQITYYLNQQIPLPDWMIVAEDSTNALVSGLLRMETPGEFVLNLFTIAILPALGEELLFRGVIQQELEKWFGNGQWAVWIAAALFSAIHFQFAGFIPRFLLGVGLGYLMYWTKNLWIPILGHFIFNGIQVVAVYVTGDVGMGEEMASEEELQEALPMLAGLSVLGVGVICYVWRFFREEERGERREERGSA